MLEGEVIPVRNDLGDVLTTVDLVDDTRQRSGLTETQRSWRVDITPYEHRQVGVGIDPETGASVDFSTWVSPEWLSTQMWQEAEVATASPPSSHEVSADTRRIVGEQVADKLVDGVVALFLEGFVDP